MPTLYIITGPAGIGKSTISKGIANRKSKSVLIEGDDIYHQVIGGYVSPWKQGNHLDTFWKVCLSDISIYLEAGFDVIFNYIISKNDLNHIQKVLEKKYIVQFIGLTASKEVLLSRDKERPEDCQMGQRCLVLLDSFNNSCFPQNNIIDTSDLSIEETINTILDGKFNISST